jgi:hypothetical protein
MGKRPKLHGMQEVKACIGLAVPSWPSCLWSPRTGASLVSATLEQRADLYLAVRPGTSKICQIALVSKEGDRRSKRAVAGVEASAPRVDPLIR